MIPLRKMFTHTNVFIICWYVQKIYEKMKIGHFTFFIIVNNEWDINFGANFRHWYILSGIKNWTALATSLRQILLTIDCDSQTLTRWEIQSVVIWKNAH